MVVADAVDFQCYNGRNWVGSQIWEFIHLLKTLNFAAHLYELEPDKNRCVTVGESASESD